MNVIRLITILYELMLSFFQTIVRPTDPSIGKMDKQVGKHAGKQAEKQADKQLYIYNRRNDCTV